MIKKSIRSFLIGVISIILPTSLLAGPIVDVVGTYIAGTNSGVENTNSVGYGGLSGFGVFDSSSVTALDGASLALGTFGSVVVSFSASTVVDGAGADLRLYDGFGVKEGVNVFASADSINWFSLGNSASDFSQSCNTIAEIGSCVSDFDLSFAGLSSASFFRIESDLGGCVSGFPQCYDLDAVEALNYTASAVPEPSALILLGLGLLGFGSKRRKLFS